MTAHVHRLVAASLVALAASGVLAGQTPIPDRTVLQESVELKDGGTLHIFRDGRMGVADRFGRSRSTKEGTAMEARDGRTILMKGNEVWRVEKLNPYRSA